VKRARTALWAAAAAAVVVSLFVAVLATRQSAESREAHSPLLGKPAPALAGNALDGRDVDVVGLQGRWVVVNFFASWCVPCQQEHPELVKFASRHAAAGDAEVVAVIWDDTVARVRRYFAQHGGHWPVIRDPAGSIALDWGVRGPPESYVVAPSGVVVAKFTGAVTANALDGVLAEGRAHGA